MPVFCTGILFRLITNDVVNIEKKRTFAPLKDTAMFG